MNVIISTLLFLVGLSFVSSRPSPQQAVRTHRAYRDIGLGECFWVIGHVPTPEPSRVGKPYELTPRNWVAGKPAKRAVLNHGFDGWKNYSYDLCRTTASVAPSTDDVQNLSHN